MLEALKRSFICSRNSRRPKMDFGGTPNHHKLHADTTVHVTCTQTPLRVHENLLLTPLSKDNLDLPNSSFFCPVISFLPKVSFLPLVHCVVSLDSLLCSVDFVFFCFQRSRTCSPTINQTFQGWFLFILICRREKFH